MRQFSATSGFRRIALPAALVLFALLLNGCALQNGPQGLQQIMQVDYVISDSRQPPPASAPWLPFKLPLGSRFADPAR
ncbi:MAG TPA: hypothetical protein VMH83_14530, partial [Candidatus Acidoferrum sp.]|nr:hypothetical protein [Candidatus Acidoferrum sp.]